jgi:hypothetical protein
MSIHNTTSNALSSTPNTSKLIVPTELQRADDFHSTTPKPIQQQEVITAGYYEGVT